jgi:hypothetical protein
MRFEMFIDHQSTEKINSQFSKTKAYVCYPGINRNQSHIGEDVINNAIYSLYNIPVVGEYLEDVENFGGHGGKVEITDKEVRFVQTTKPFGIVPESCNPRYEFVADRYTGEMRKYLVVDVILWSGRYPEVQTVLENGAWQSMELENIEGDWVTFKDDEGFMRDIFKMSKIEFSALCILGKSEDPDVDVEPCFPDAQIASTFSNRGEAFDMEFALLRSEFQKSTKEGGTDMTDDVKTDVNDELIADDAELEDQTDSLTEAEEETQDNSETEEQETADVEESDESLSDVEEGDADDQTDSDNQEEAEETTESQESTEDEHVDYQAMYEELAGKYALLEEEVTQLRTIASEVKHAEIEAVFERFSSELDATEVAELRENSGNMSVSDIESALFAMVGRKKFQASKSTKQTVRVSTFAQTSEEPEPYGELSRLFNN